MLRPYRCCLKLYEIKSLCLCFPAVGGLYDALKSAASEEIHITYQQVTGNVLCLAMSVLGFSEIHASVDGLTIKPSLTQTQRCWWMNINIYISLRRLQ